MNSITVGKNLVLMFFYLLAVLTTITHALLRYLPHLGPNSLQLVLLLETLRRHHTERTTQHSLASRLLNADVRMNSYRHGSSCLLIIPFSLFQNQADGTKMEMEDDKISSKRTLIASHATMLFSRILLVV